MNDGILNSKERIQPNGALNDFITYAVLCEINPSLRVESSEIHAQPAPTKTPESSSDFAEEIQTLTLALAHGES